MTDHMSPNSREALGVLDSITGDFFYLTGTSITGALNVNATVSIVGTISSNITQIGGAPITLGQKTMANSFPVTIASNQSPLQTLEQTGLLPVEFDAVEYTNTSSTVDTYEYYLGGLGGTLEATITVTWTNSTKSVLVSAVRT